MLVGGETIFQGRFSIFGFLIYWLACFLFTSMAVLIALRDFRALKRRTIEEQRSLFQTTLTEIANDARSKPHSPGQTPPSSDRGRKG